MACATAFPLAAFCNSDSNVSVLLLEKEKAALAEEVSPCAFQSSCQNHSDENTSSVSGEMPSENTSQALTPESSFDLSGQSDSNENNTENLS